MNIYPNTQKRFILLAFIFSLNFISVAIAGQASLPLPPTTSNDNFRSIGESLYNACQSASGSFFSDCFDALTDAQNDKNTISALTPDELTANNTNISSSAVNSSLVRLGALRKMGGAASADSAFSRFSVYTNGYSSWQQYNQQGLNPGFKLFDSKATLGADYRFTDNFIIGLSSSFLNSDSQLKQGAGNIDTDGYSFAIYSSFYVDNNFFIDGSFAYSDQATNTSRNVSYGVTNQIASANFDSDTYSAGFVTGYNFFNDGWTLTPTARWMYRNIKMDGYTESLSNPTAAGGSLALAIGKQQYESMTGNFGAQLSYAWSQSWGVLIPTFSAEYIHEFSNNSKTVNARFIKAPTGTGAFTVTSSKMDTDYASISAGVSTQFSQGVSAFLNYEKLLDLKSVTSDSVSMGIRLELD